MLDVRTENRGNAVIVRCSGRLVAGEEAWSLYNTVISQPGKRVVVLDLREVHRMDAAGLGALVSLKRWARGANVKLELIPSPVVRRLLQVTELGSLFDIRAAEKIPSSAELWSENHRNGSDERQCA